MPSSPSNRSAGSDDLHSATGTLPEVSDARKSGRDALGPHVRRAHHQLPCGPSPIPCPRPLPFAYLRTARAPCMSHEIGTSCPTFVLNLSPFLWTRCTSDPPQ